jgi:sterol desaturase/sphingolipid hydroxylase (fatty acid hydroxylase superfamily)
MADACTTAFKRACQWLIWPVCLAAHSGPIIVTASLVPHVLSPIAALATATLTLILLVVEDVLPHRADWSLRGDEDIWRDLGHALAYAGLAMNTSRMLFLAVLPAAMSPLHLTNVFGLWPHTGPLWVQITLVIVLGDMLEYAFHRLSHVIALLWRLHAIHHTPVRLHALKAARHHAGYAVARGVFVWVPLLILGAPAALIVWQFIAETITGLVAHANIEFRIPAFAHRLAVTPEFHRVHHSADPRLGNANFGAVFPIWDMLFGTHVDPLKVEVGDAGIRNDPVPRDFMQELKWPLTPHRIFVGRDPGREKVERSHPVR